MINEVEHISHTSFEYDSAFIVCQNCKTSIPSISLIQHNHEILLELDCLSCNKTTTFGLEEYLSFLREDHPHYCTNKENILKPADFFCLNCRKWLCQSCLHDHEIYSELNQHVKARREVIIDFKCPLHKEKTVRYFCTQCNNSLCNKCLTFHTHHSSVVSCNETNQIDITEEFKHCNEIRLSNSKRKDKLILMIDSEIGSLSQLKEDLIQSFERNNKQNQLIQELLMITYRNIASIWPYHSYQLESNLKKIFIPNQSKILFEETRVESTCRCFIEYLDSNYLVEVKSLKREENDLDKPLTNVKGKMTYPNGDVFYGEIIENLKEGNGIYSYYADNSQYEGSFIKDKMEGKGKMTYSDGSIYEGQWKDSLLHGEGTYQFANGRKYVGSFLNGERHGKGKMTYTDGSVYEGDWVEGDKHGYGIYHFANGRVQKGLFVEGRFMGENN